MSPCGRGVYHKVEVPYVVLFWFMYIVQLYKEDWTILRMLVCRASSPEELFQLSRANTTQTIWEFAPLKRNTIFILEKLKFTQREDKQESSLNTAIFGSR